MSVDRPSKRLLVGLIAGAQFQDGSKIVLSSVGISRQFAMSAWYPPGVLSRIHHLFRRRHLKSYFVFISSAEHGSKVSGMVVLKLRRVGV